MSRRKPNPARFEDYEENKDATGFTIQEKGRSIEFYYDQDKGWFDEDGNYYNKDGQPTKPSQQSFKFWDSIKYKYQQNYDYYDDEDDDDLLMEYEKGNNADDGDEGDDDLIEQAEIEEEIAKLRAIVKGYGEEQDVKIYFDGMRWQNDQKEIQKLFGNVKDVVINRKGKFPTGQGHVIASKQDALRIIELHRSEFKNEQITLQVDALDVLDDPEDLGEVLNINKGNNELKKNRSEPVQLLRNQNPMPVVAPQQQQKQQQASIPQTKPSQQEQKIQQLPETKPQPQPQPQPQQQTKQSTKQDVPKPQQQLTGFDLQFSGIHLDETKSDFETWLKSKTDKVVYWTEIREKALEKAKLVRVNFSKVEDAKKILELFSNPQKIMYKSKYTIQVKQAWS